MKYLPETFVGTYLTLSIVLIATASYLPATFFEPFLLSAVLNTIFIGFGDSLVAYVSARSYLKTSAPIFIMLGSALLMSDAGALSFWITANSNFRTTIGSITALLSGILQICAAVLAYRNLHPDRPSNHLKAKLFSTYGAVIITVVLMGIATIITLIPPFFVQGLGGTPLRQAVVASAISAIAVASVLMLRLYQKRHDAILKWYGLALSLLALGVTDGFFALTLGGILSWVGRISVYMSGIYFILLVFKGAKSQASLP